MAFVWGVLAITAILIVVGMIYRSTRRRREYLVLALTARIDLPVTPSVIERVDLRLRDRLVGFSLGALLALLGFGAVFWLAPEFIPTGLAGFATAGIFLAVAATGSAASALRQFPRSGGADTARVARLDSPILADYVNPGWLWAAAGGTALGVALAVGLLTGAVPTHPGNAGISLSGVAVLAVLSTGGVIGAILLSRALLAVPQPASTELDLHWDDVLRASALRDIWIASIGLAAATVIAACSWTLDQGSPSFYAIAFLGSAPMILFSLPASRRPSQRLWQHVHTVS